MLLIVAYSSAIHACYLGSKIVVSLYALHLGASQTTMGMLAALYAAAPVFWFNAANLTAISFLVWRQ